QFVQFVSVTADGKNVYASATDSHTIAGFARNPSTGALTQLPPPDGCVKDFDNGDTPCRPGFGLSLPLAVIPSPDGTLVSPVSAGDCGPQREDRQAEGRPPATRVPCSGRDRVLRQDQPRRERHCQAPQARPGDLRHPLGRVEEDPATSQGPREETAPAAEAL